MKNKENTYDFGKTLKEMRKFLASKINSLPVKSGIVEFETFHYNKAEVLDSKPKRHKHKRKFDFVIKNKDGEIISVGDFIPDDEVQSTSKLNALMDYTSNSPYPVFYFTESWEIFFLDGNVRNEVIAARNVNRDVYGKEFFEILKQTNSTLKFEEEIILERLRFDIEEQKNQLSKNEREISDLKYHLQNNQENCDRTRKRLERQLKDVYSQITDKQREGVKNIITDFRIKIAPEPMIIEVDGKKMDMTRIPTWIYPYYKRTIAGRIILGIGFLVSSADYFETVFENWWVVDLFGNTVPEADYTDEEKNFTKNCINGGAEGFVCFE